jgi:hypothetical protein
VGDSSRYSRPPVQSDSNNLYSRVALMSTTEHILLESDVREVPDLRAARKVHARIGLRSRLRRRAVQLDIIDYCYLSVRSWRSRTPMAEYVLDLRFVDTTPRLSKHFAWRWMLAALALIVLAAAIAARIGSSGWRSWQHDWLVPFLVVAVSGALAALVCAYRSSETVTIYSAHGRAKLLEFTGGLGTLRAARPFLAKLAAHIRVAAQSRRRSKSEHLRDEMREHFRLKEIRLLCVNEYEAAKARILGQHGH